MLKSRAALGALHQAADTLPSPSERVILAKEGDETALIRLCPLATAAITTPGEEESSSNSVVLVVAIQWRGCTWVLQKQALEVLCCGLLPTAASLVVVPDAGSSSTSSSSVVADAPAWLLRAVRSAGVVGLARVTVAKLLRLDAAFAAAQAAVASAPDASRKEKEFAQLWLEYARCSLPWASSGATPMPKQFRRRGGAAAAAAADEEGGSEGESSSDADDDADG